MHVSHRQLGCLKWECFGRIVEHLGMSFSSMECPLMCRIVVKLFVTVSNIMMELTNPWSPKAVSLLGQEVGPASFNHGHLIEKGSHAEGSNLVFTLQLP